MLAIRTSAEQDRYGPSSEWDAVFSTVRSGRPPLIWCHGNFGTALGDYTTYNPELRLLAQRYTVVVADLGFNTFGNDTGVTRVGQAIDYLAASWASSGPAVLVGASMGAAVALNYAVRHPANVAAVVGIIPVVEFDAPGGPGVTQLNAAYPPAWDKNNATHQDHNPVHFAPDIAADMPIHLFTSSNDTSAPPVTAAAFVAARPQTQHTSFGAYGHGGVNVAVPLAANWLAAL